MEHGSFLLGVAAAAFMGLAKIGITDDWLKQADVFGLCAVNKRLTQTSPKDQS